MATIGTVLNPQIVSELVSRQMVAEQWILEFMGFLPGGRNEEYLGHGRRGTYDVFDSTRTVGEGRIPGTAAATVSPNKVGTVSFAYPRMHENIPILAEEASNLRVPGSDATRDVNGNAQLALQTRYCAQRAANFRAALTLGMLRDQLYFTRSGDSLYPTFVSTNNKFQTEHQMPAGNKTQLDMLGDGNIIDVSWDNPSADIPKHLGEINAAFEELYGGRLEYVMVQSAVWNHIIKNDAVGSEAGIANTPFTRFRREIGTRADGSPLNVAIGVLTSYPDVEFIITDSGLKMGAPGSETYQKYAPDNGALFLPNPDQGNFKMRLGSEPIAEYDGAERQVKVGLSTWTNETSNPTTTNIFALDNALAINTIPNSVANGTVVF